MYIFFPWCSHNNGQRLNHAHDGPSLRLLAFAHVENGMHSTSHPTHSSGADTPLTCSESIATISLIFSAGQLPCCRGLCISACSWYANGWGVTCKLCYCKLLIGVKRSVDRTFDCWCRGRVVNLVINCSLVVDECSRCQKSFDFTTTFDIINQNKSASST